MEIIIEDKASKLLHYFNLLLTFVFQIRLKEKILNINLKISNVLGFCKKIKVYIKYYYSVLLMYLFDKWHVNLQSVFCHFKDILSI